MAFYFVKGDPVTAAVRILDVLHARLRKTVDQLRGHVGQRVIQPAVAYVVDLAPYQGYRRFQHAHDGRRGIGDMQERSPLFAVVDGNNSFFEGLRRKQIDDQVESRPRRQAEYGGEAQNRGMETLIGGGQQRLLGIDLGIRVKGDRLNFGVLVHNLFGCAVDAATGRENEALHLFALGDFDHHAGGRVVDLLRGLVILIAGRIADDGGQMNHRARAAHRAHHILNVTAITPHELQAWVVEHFLDGRCAVNQTVEYPDSKAPLQK